MVFLCVLNLHNFNRMYINRIDLNNTIKVTNIKSYLSLSLDVTESAAIDTSINLHIALLIFFTPATKA